MNEPAETFWHRRVLLGDEQIGWGELGRDLGGVRENLGKSRGAVLRGETE